MREILCVQGANDDGLCAVGTDGWTDECRQERCGFIGAANAKLLIRFGNRKNKTKQKKTTFSTTLSCLCLSP